MLSYIKTSVIVRWFLLVLGGVLMSGSDSELMGAESVDEAVQETPPVVVKQVRPHYPDEFRRNGTMGGAIVEFVITKEGDVLEPKSVSETHADFGKEAVKSVAKWKFKPATKYGRPINTYRGVPIYFTLEAVGDEDWPAKIQAVITGFPPQSPSGVPEEFRYDKAPDPLSVQAPVWPWENGIPVREGTADLFFAINAQGIVTQVKVISATNVAFGEAARAALECWKFKPAERDGKPVPALGRKEVQFKLYLPKDASELRLMKEIKKGRAHFAKVSELDKPLRRAYAQKPRYPMSLIEDQPPGTALIECIIDEDGRVCLPRIIEASEEEFGWAAATALLRFRFVPPRVKGEPVDVRVRIPFEFKGRDT